MRNKSEIEQLVFEECRYPYILQVSDGYRYFRLCCFIFDLTLILLTTIWAYKRRGEKNLSVRTFYSVILIALANIARTLSTTLSEFTLDKESFLNQCEVFESLHSFAPAGFAGALFLRVIMYYNGYKLYETIAKKPQVITVLEEGSKRTSYFSKPATVTNSKLHRISDDFARKLFFIFLGLSMLFSMVNVLISCPNASFLPNLDCTFVPGSFTLQVRNGTVGVLIILALVFTIYKTKGFPDPFGVLKEVKVLMPLYFFFYTLTAVLLNVPFFKPVNEDLYVPFTPFLTGMSLLAFIGWNYAVTYQVYLTYKSSEGSFELTLDKVLETPELKSLFKRHLESEAAGEVLRFYDVVNEFKKNAGKLDHDALLAQSKNIYRKYVSFETAEFPINISHEMRSNLKDKHDNETVEANMFDSAQNEMYTILAYDGFPRFMRGPYFALFLGLTDKDTLERFFD